MSIKGCSDTTSEYKITKCIISLGYLGTGKNKNMFYIWTLIKQLHQECQKFKHMLLSSLLVTQPYII